MRSSFCRSDTQPWLFILLDKHSWRRNLQIMNALDKKTIGGKKVENRFYEPRRKLACSASSHDPHEFPLPDAILRCKLGMDFQQWLRVLINEFADPAGLRSAQILRNNPALPSGVQNFRSSHSRCVPGCSSEGHGQKTPMFFSIFSYVIPK